MKGARPGVSGAQYPTVIRLPPEQDAASKAAAEAFLDEQVFSAADREVMDNDIRWALAAASVRKQAAAGHQPAA